MERNNYAERIDHRSYERQEIDQIPTIHLGVAANQMEQRGIVTERGNTNRKIVSMNQELRQLRARIGKLQKWVDTEAKVELGIQKSDLIQKSHFNSFGYYQKPMNGIVSSIFRLLLFAN